MIRLLKIALAIVIFFAITGAIKVAIPYFRYFDIKGKIKDAIRTATLDSDTTIARGLAEAALDDKLPIVGDYYFQVQDDKGNKFIYTPETAAQEREYLDSAMRYFLDNIERRPGVYFAISVKYVQEIYFPFGYTYRMNFEDREIQQLTH